MAIAKGRRVPRYEDMEQEALLDQMVDAPTPYSGGEPTYGSTALPGGDGPQHKLHSDTPAPSGPTANTPGERGPSVGGGSTPPPAGPSSTPGAPGGRWNDRYEWESSEGGPSVRDIQVGDTRRVTGANTAGWGTGERGTESMKNTFLMIASNVDPRQPGAARTLMARDDFKRFFPNARLIEHPKGDLIDFGDGSPPTDVLRNAVAGGSGDAWQWPTGSSGASGGVGGGVTTGAGPLMENVSGVSLPEDQATLMRGLISELGFQPGEGDSFQGEFNGNTAPASSPVKDLMAEITAAQNGQQSPMDLQALLQLLGQQRGA